MADMVQKLWGFCHTLRHGGVDYGNYIEQITYLLFIKMADQSGMALTDHYTQVINCLGRQDGILGDIYAKSQKPLQQPRQPQAAHRPDR